MRFPALILFALLAVQGSLHADDAIAAAQRKLKTLGYYQGGVDGQNGSQTAAAIRRYQIAEDLRVTGELTPQTTERLGIAAPKAGKPAATPAPEYVSIAGIFKGGPYIQMPTETQIETLRSAQRNLKLLGYYTGPVDGRPGPALVSAIKAWQKSAGFRQSGRFDESTLKGLDLMPSL